MHRSRWGRWIIRRGQSCDFCLYKLVYYSYTSVRSFIVLQQASYMHLQQLGFKPRSVRTLDFWGLVWLASFIKVVEQITTKLKPRWHYVFLTLKLAPSVPQICPSDDAFPLLWHNRSISNCSPYLKTICRLSMNSEKERPTNVLTFGCLELQCWRPPSLAS